MTALGIAKYCFVMKVSPDAVAIREQKAWTNRRLASGIVTLLLPDAFNFLPLLRCRPGNLATEVAEDAEAARMQIRNPSVDRGAPGRNKHETRDRKRDASWVAQGPRKKTSDRWNDVLTGRPENIDFWRMH
jgi:hypothetical protein